MFLFHDDPEQEKEYCNACMHYLCFGIGFAWVCCVAGKEDLGLEVLRHTIEVIFIPMILSFYVLLFVGMYRLAMRAVRWFRGM